MPPTRQECLTLVKKPSAQEHDIAVSLLETAAVHAAELTGHPGWDRFLEQCQAMLNENQAQALSWTEALKHALSNEKIREAQMNVVCYETRVNILKHVMQLPGEIVKERHATQS